MQPLGETEGGEVFGGVFGTDPPGPSVSDLETLLGRSAAREMRCFFCDSNSHLAAACPREGRADALWAAYQQPGQLRDEVGHLRIELDRLRSENRALALRVASLEALPEPVPAPLPAPPLAGPAGEGDGGPVEEDSEEEERSEDLAERLLTRIGEYEAVEGPRDGRLDDLLEAEGELVRWKKFVADRWPGEEDRKAGERALEMARAWGFKAEEERPEGSLVRVLWRERALHGGPWLVRRKCLQAAIRIEFGVE